MGVATITPHALAALGRSGPPVELLDEIEEHRQVARIIAGRDVEGARRAMLRILDVQPEAGARS